MSKVKSRQASNSCKRLVEAPKLAYANKTKDCITSQNFGSRYFWRKANSALNNGKAVIPPLFNGSDVMFSASDKAKLFAENFSKNSNLDDAGMFLLLLLILLLLLLLLLSPPCHDHYYYYYLLLLLLFEVLNPKGQSLKASRQAWRYFHSDS